MRVLIVGAGIAGSALFRCLQAQDMNVEIVEKAASLTCEGAAICLPANAMLELEKLGLADKVCAKAHQVHEIEYAKANGQTLAKASLDEAPLDKAPFVALRRDALMAILRDDIAQHIQLATWPTALEQQSNQVLVKFNNGKSEHYDLVVAADGINSQTRAFVQPNSPLIKPQVTNWRFIAPKPRANFQPVYYVGHNDLFMIYPISDSEVYCYAHVSDASGHYHQMPAQQALRALFSDYAQPIVQCLNAINDETAIVTGELKSVAQTQAIFGRVVLVGDALHGCPPSLQQGAGMSLEDINCLAKLLEDIHADDIPSALTEFEKIRSQRVSWTVSESNKIIKLANLGKSFFGRIIRNFIIRKKGPANVVGWRKLLSQNN
ncbi:FAD-dependent monooxygenase [Pseudoalteromonas sp. S16_S37]|uniref:FAD-dependent monooxygenase n=1 Tax=Pseudoalteromonas sp. S16_S37 TaxID=2720228 RepID=UPI0016801A82|nr:monooxygenase [Pseudoalteromonas sp. S16_S37]